MISSGIDETENIIATETEDSERLANTSQNHDAGLAVSTNSKESSITPKPIKEFLKTKDKENIAQVLRQEIFERKQITKNSPQNEDEFKTMFCSIKYTTKPSSVYRMSIDVDSAMPSGNAKVLSIRENQTSESLSVASLLQDEYIPDNTQRIATSLEHISVVREPTDFAYKKFLSILASEWKTEFLKLNDFIDSFPILATQLPFEKLGKTVQNFLMEFSLTISSKKPGNHFNEPLLVYDCIERFFMDKCYRTIYPLCDLNKDMEFYEQVVHLSFVESSHLDIKPEFVNEKLWNLAGEELLKASAYHSPHAKFARISKCCEKLLDLKHFTKRSLFAKRAKAITADDFIPSLVMVLLRTNPPSLPSTLQFISTFRSPALIPNKQSYYFVSVQLATAFILSINEKSLTIDPEKFALLSQTHKKVIFSRTPPIVNTSSADSPLLYFGSSPSDSASSSLSSDTSDFASMRHSTIGINSPGPFLSSFKSQSSTIIHSEKDQSFSVITLPEFEKIEPIPTNTQSQTKHSDEADKENQNQKEKREPKRIHKKSQSVQQDTKTPNIRRKIFSMFKK